MSIPTRQQLFRIRKVLTYVSGCIGGGVFLLKMIPQVFPGVFLNPKEDEELPRDVSHRYYDILHDVAAKIKLEKSEKIRLVITNKPYASHAGAPYLPNGGVIWLPENAKYHSKEDIMENMTFKGQTINWNSKGGKIMLNNTLLNDANISFIMAHELARMKSFDYVLKVIELPCWFFASIEIIKYALKRHFKKQKRSHIAVVVIAGTAFCMMSYVFGHYALEFWLLKNADESAARSGIEIANGGVEYLVKRMRVNKVLKVLMEDDKEKYINASGDDKRFNELPLSVRLENLDRIAKLELDKRELISQMFED